MRVFQNIEDLLMYFCYNFFNLNWKLDVCKNIPVIVESTSLLEYGKISDPKPADFSTFQQRQRQQ